MVTYKEIKKRIEEEILRGSFQNGDLYGKMDELCKRFGVSRMTAHRAIHKLKEEGIVYTRQGKGIHIDDPELVYEKHAKNNFIAIYGMHYLRSDSFYFSYRNEAVLQYFQKNHFGVKFVNYPKANLFGKMKGLKGIIMGSHYWTMNKREIKKLNVPVVLYNNTEKSQVSSVNWDNKQIVVEASKYFLSEGIKTLAVITLRKDDVIFTDFFKKCFPGKIVTFSFKECAIAEGMKLARELSLSGLPDGIFVSDDFIMLGMLMTFQRARIKIPDELKIVVSSAPNSPLLKNMGIPTIGCSPQLVGNRAAKLLHEMIITARQNTEIVNIQPEFIVPEKEYSKKMYGGSIC